MEESPHFCERNERPCRAQSFDDRDRRIARLVYPTATLVRRDFTEICDAVELAVVEQGQVIDSFSADYAKVMADTLRCMATDNCPFKLDIIQGE